MTSITLFIMLDACGPDYIRPETTPFLYRMGLEGGFTPLAPPFGFEPDAAYLAGLYPDEALQGAQFWYDPEKSPFKRMFPQALTPLMDQLPGLAKKVIRKTITALARNRCPSPHLSAAQIPFSLLSSFALPVNQNLDHQGFSPSASIFDLLRQYNRPYLFHGAPEHAVTREAALDRAVRDLHPPLAFSFFHIGTLDRVGHAFGPDSAEIKKALAAVDRDLEQMYAIANQRFDRVNFLVMGDHGMTRVTRFCDLGAALDRLNREQGLVMGKEYLVFLDSTMARFWFFKPGIRDLVRERLLDLSDQYANGRFLTQEDRIRWHLNYPDSRFGELIFLAHPGVLIFPNFFQEKEAVKGMHGYAPDTPGQLAALIMKTPGFVPAALDETLPHMTRIFPTLCELLTLKSPGLSGSKSLVMS